MENWRGYLAEENVVSGTQNREILVEIHKLIKRHRNLLTEGTDSVWSEGIKKDLDRLRRRYGKKAIAAAVAATLGLATPSGIVAGADTEAATEEHPSFAEDAYYGWEPNGTPRANYNLINDQFDHGLIEATKLLRWYEEEIRFLDEAIADYNALLKAGVSSSEAAAHLVGPEGSPPRTKWDPTAPKWSGFQDWVGMPPYQKTNKRPLKDIYSDEMKDLRRVIDRVGDFKSDGTLGADVEQ